MLTEEARKARNDYQKDWRRRNPQKQKEYSDRHWEKVAKEARAKEEAETK